MLVGPNRKARLATIDLIFRTTDKAGIVRAPGARVEMKVDFNPQD